MRVLTALTSHDGLQDQLLAGGTRGAYYAFKDARAQITLALPKGGRQPLDPKSNEPNFQTDVTRRFEERRPSGLRRLRRSVPYPRQQPVLSLFCPICYSAQMPGHRENLSLATGEDVADALAFELRFKVARAFTMLTNSCRRSSQSAWPRTWGDRVLSS